MVDDDFNKPLPAIFATMVDAGGKICGYGIFFVFVRKS